jgi:type VII secretion-associated serine protease mycosin
VRKVIALSLALLLGTVVTQSAQADSIRDRQYWLSDYGFTSAWESSRGEGVLVAIIDTGIDPSHPALSGAVSGGTDVSGLGSSDGLTAVGANSYHGTMVASLLAGRGTGSDSLAGVIGAAPEAKLLSVSMAFGVDGLDTDDQLARGVIWAVDNGAQVINLSLTRNSTSWPKSWDEAFLYAFENDVVIVAAVGNRAAGTEFISAPATIPGVIAVAGLDREGKASESYSLEGFSASVSAPAEDLVAAYPGGEYRIWSGSSAAAPIVAGLVALIRAKYPDLNAPSVVNRVLLSANREGIDGFSTAYGYGRIDAELALNGDFPIVSENPLGELSEWIELYRPTQDDTEPAGEIVPPEQTQLVELQPPGLQPGQLWWPIAGYAGVGLMAAFLYLAFRPSSHNGNQRKK